MHHAIRIAAKLDKKSVLRWLLNATFTNVIDSDSDPQPLDDDPRPDLPRQFIQ